MLEKLLNIKNRLTALRRDRSSYLKTQDILPLKHETEEAIDSLCQIRNGFKFGDEGSQNRTDDVLDEVCQLLSLSFLCLGKTRESKSCFYAA